MGDFLLDIIELFFARCFRFVTIHAFDRQTDGQMLIGKIALHTMQRSKNDRQSLADKCNICQSYINGARNVLTDGLQLARTRSHSGTAGRTSQDGLGFHRGTMASTLNTPTLWV